MAFLDRIAFGGLAIGVLLAARGALVGAQDEVAAQRAPVAPATPAAPALGIDAELVRFKDQLVALRSGDATALEALRATSERLCRVHLRCDTGELVEFYAALPPAELELGLAEEALYNAQWQRVLAAGRQQLDTSDWKDVREEILDELRRLITRVSAHGGDITPAARALSLCARLETEQLGVDAELNVQEHEELIARAEKDAQQSLELFKRAGMLTPRLEPLWLRARLAAARGESSKARANFEESLALARRLARPEYQEHALDGLIDLAFEAGDDPAAARLLHELALFETPQASWVLARRQAELLLRRDQASLAIEFLERSAPRKARDLRTWHLLLGGARLRAGDLAGARAEYLADEKLPWSVDTRLAMASLDLREKNSERVVGELGVALDEPGLSSYQRAQARALVGEAWFELGHDAHAIHALSSALELAAQWQTRLESERAASGGATSIIGERLGLHSVALLAHAHARSGDALEAARVIETHQSRNLRSTLADVSVRVSTASSAPVTELDGAPRDRLDPVRASDLTREDIETWAGSFELGLLTAVVSADACVVAHVAPDGRAQAYSIPHGRVAIEEAVRRVREALIAGDRATSRMLADELRDVLFPGALLERIAARAATSQARLLFSMHGPLERLPLEAFEIAGKPIDQCLVPLVLPGLPERRPGARLASDALDTWSLLGNPLDAQGAARLAGARAELASLAELRPASSARLGREFDRAALLAALTSGRPLHVATHLRYGCDDAAGRLSDVGLELSGGALFSARELFETRPRLPLAVLAACETGEGRFIDAEGLQGTARVFLESGTRNVLVTLWPVEDRAAHDFALEFHRALLAHEAPAQAASSARRKLRDQGAPSADWAAFRLLGRD